MQSSSGRITFNLYLKKYPVKPSDKYLIIGTIHPYSTEQFKIPFFYGNKSSIWTILHEAYPHLLTDPTNLSEVLAFLNRNHIAVSDTIVEGIREKTNASDDDLIPLKLNHQLIDDLKNSQIERIFCTSGFGKSSAFKLFYNQILELPLTPSIRKSRKATLPAHMFGRQIEVEILYSPSGAANPGISLSAEYKQWLARLDKARKTPVKDFKVEYYRKRFAFVK